MLGEMEPIRETSHLNVLTIRNELWRPWHKRWEELDGVDLYDGVAQEPGAGAICWALGNEAQDAR